jgi:Mn-containing catalase
MKYRDMLLNTGTEEIAHIEMLATAVALNLEGSSADVKDAFAKGDGAVGAVMGGTDVRHVLSAGLGAMASDANGVPFNGSWVVSSGNIAADMYANVMAESTGRLLATRLYEMTDDTGMKEMLAFLIARDTMHQNQWLAVIEELGGSAALPIPNSFPQEKENQDVNYTFFTTGIDGVRMPDGRFTSGDSIDRKGTFKVEQARPFGDIPQLGNPDLEAHSQKEQITGNSKSFLEKAADVITGS